MKRYPPTCARCGIIRPSEGYRSPICRDCSGGLSATEREEWDA